MGGVKVSGEVSGKRKEKMLHKERSVELRRVEVSKREL